MAGAKAEPELVSESSKTAGGPALSKVKGSARSTQANPGSLNQKSDAMPVKRIVEAADSDTEITDNAQDLTEVASATMPKASAAHANVHRTKAVSTTTSNREEALSEGSEDPDTTVAANDAPNDESVVPGPKSQRTSNGKASVSKVADSKTSNIRTSNNKTRSDLGIHAARPTAHGDRSLVRALGLKIGRIVIDPGHGGHDTGTIGPDGLQEKDLVLEVGKRLGKMLETRLGAEVVYTRKDDTFIPLETRTAIANKERADLFISIHANSSDDPAARGVETYYLNFTSSPDALEVAARENAVSEKSIYELRDLVKKIALKDKIEESREFAGDVQQSLHTGLAAKSPAIRDRGVKKAPFIVLIGANMPSILAEISFVSNPTDEHRLETAEYRQRIADSLYRGVAKYVSGLSGVKVASKLDKAAGQ
jgi:N-acetylmuramoyl-L-alanine amidase